MGIGDLAGRIKAGWSADLAVLDRNLFQIDPEDIHRTRVVRTYFAGRVVHEAEVP
jgi:predicted amidohydrolase YtcJ